MQIKIKIGIMMIVKMILSTARHVALSTAEFVMREVKPARLDDDTERHS